METNWIITDVLLFIALLFFVIGFLVEKVKILNKAVIGQNDCMAKYLNNDHYKSENDTLRLILQRCKIIKVPGCTAQIIQQKINIGDFVEFRYYDGNMNLFKTAHALFIVERNIWKLDSISFPDDEDGTKIIEYICEQLNNCQMLIPETKENYIEVQGKDARSLLMKAKNVINTYDVIKIDQQLVSIKKAK